MKLFDVIAILVTLTALLNYFNHRYVRLHPSVGVMLIALLLSLALIGLGALGLGVRSAAMEFLQHVHFGDALLTWMLGFLLFGGALTVDINELRRQWGVITMLATVGTVASMFIVAGLARVGLNLIGFPLPWIWCLLFGALISPTDPVAVVAVTRQAGAGKAIDTVVSAESLFNDGVAVVLFLTILQTMNSPGLVTAGSVARMLAQEVAGGAVLGFCTGIVVYRMLKRTRDFQVEVLLTLALVMGTYALAAALGMSAPIAVVVAGLLIGNRGRNFRMSEQVNIDLERFWELVEGMLNAVLFVLMGVELLVMPYTPRHFLAAMIAIPIVLLARLASVTAIVGVIPSRPRIGWPTAAILVWGGLRGGLAVAMALSLPQGSQRDLIVAVTYGVVCFSILIQGLTIRSLVQRAILFSPGR
jgi:CPA1 family monovalent cation:H+ antiporter